MAYLGGMVLRRLKAYWQSLRYWVTLDPADNGVTLSRRLWRHMSDNAAGGGKPLVFVFSIPGRRTFGFAVDPLPGRETQLCEIQYNDRYRCIGFETLCPSVGGILYEFSLPADRKVRLSVSVHRTVAGMTYYQMERPDAGLVEKFKEA